MNQQNSRILVVDDEKPVLLLIQRILEQEGYRVITAENGEIALEYFTEQTPDLVLLDIKLPGMDGYAICQHIRDFSNVPIIMLTAMRSDDEIVKGLTMGADDYITKPFSGDILKARIKAALRRSQTTLPLPANGLFKSGNLEIDFIRSQVTINGKEVRLTPIEFHILQELVVNHGNVLTHSDLLSKIWGPEYQDDTQYLHVFIGSLRTKLGLGHQGSSAIENISGVGYRFQV